MSISVLKGKMLIFKLIKYVSYSQKANRTVEEKVCEKIQYESNHLRALINVKQSSKIQKNDIISD